MPILSGIDAIRTLRKVGSRAEVMFLTIHSGADFVRLCLAVGAKGYLVKSQLDSELSPALREIIAGRSFVSAAAENTN
jgi:DNA-binding NarL/FixJ family response regulator